jgi:WD40 repeat protein
LGQVTSVSWSPDGHTLASGSDDDMVRLWDARTGQPLRTLQGHSFGVLSVSWSPDGHTLASGSYDHMVRLWDARTGQQLDALQEGPDSQLGHLAWLNPLLRCWRWLLGLCGGRNADHRLQGHWDRVTSVSWSPDGHSLASSSYDHTVRLWDARTGQPLHTLQGHWDRVTLVNWSPDGHSLASSSYDHTVRLWDARTGQPLHTLQGHSSTVRSVSWSPDGQTLASGSDDHTVRLWDARTGQPLHTLQGHLGQVNAVSWSPDGHTLASGSDDRTVRLWDVRIGLLLAYFPCRDPVGALWFHPSGRYLHATELGWATGIPQTYFLEIVHPGRP